MHKLIRGHSEKTGLAPGTLVHIGDKRTEDVRITVFSYDDSEYQEREVGSVQECVPLKGERTVTWVNVDGVHQLSTVEEIGQWLDLHPLTLEDVVNLNQRPKIEDYDGYIYIVLNMLRYDDRMNTTMSEQISLVLGPDYLISFQESAGDVFDRIRERIRTAKGRLRKMGSDYLAYTLMDTVTDYYFVVLEKIGERIESLEDTLVKDPTPEALQAIHELRREMIFLRKSVWPLREVIGGLERGESGLVGENIGVYLRDLYDHTIQIIDTTETLRDMLAGMLDIYLSSISNRMNEVMKVLTIIATIFIPLTFMAGIYGMNFKYMPELDWPWGYPMLWLIMLAVATVMLFYFRRRKWL